MNLVEHYENELRKKEKEIEELWEVGKTSDAKLKRKRELELILTGLTATTQIKKLSDENHDLKKRLKMEGLKIE